MTLGPLTISTASSVVLTNAAAWPELKVDGAGSVDRGVPQLLRLFVAVDSNTTALAGSTFLLYLVLSDPSGVYGVVKATCTITAVRTAVGGASGGYLCTVDIGGRDSMDLNGAEDTPGSAATRKTWKAGCPEGFPAGCLAVTVYGAATSIV